MLLKKTAGQAVIEYLLLFAFMALISINFVKGLSAYINETQGSLAFYLSQHLTVGVCSNDCFIDSYGNKSF